MVGVGYDLFCFLGWGEFVVLCRIIAIQFR